MLLRSSLYAVCFMCLAACQPATQSAPSFDEALSQHIHTIKNRDLEGYTKTITAAPDLPLIFPDGSYIATRQEVLEFHENWFADKNWQFDLDVVRTHVSGNLAVATLKTSYKDTPSGEPRAAYLGLVFELQDGQWRLIHDQNTRIVESN